jgi:hypothetical protein
MSQSSDFDKIVRSILKKAAEDIIAAHEAFTQNKISDLGFNETVAQILQERSEAQAPVISASGSTGIIKKG